MFKKIFLFMSLYSALIQSSTSEKVPQALIDHIFQSHKHSSITFEDLGINSETSWHDAVKACANLATNKYSNLGKKLQAAGTGIWKITENNKEKKNIMLFKTNVQQERQNLKLLGELKPTKDTPRPLMSLENCYSKKHICRKIGSQKKKSQKNMNNSVEKFFENSQAPGIENHSIKKRKLSSFIEKRKAPLQKGKTNSQNPKSKITQE